MPDARFLISVSGIRYRPMKKCSITLLVIIILSSGCGSDNAERQSAVRTYKNPLYHADYPDPDVIRVGNDFYMVTSSFTYGPGLPIFGPYEERIVMHQGTTDINGPHQGAWVELESGEHWFIHFQDRSAYGRVLHLNPMTWLDDGWPIIGIDKDGDGIGEPVRSFRYPACSTKLSADGHTDREIGLISQQTSDGFDSAQLSLQWRWQANYREEWFSLTANSGYLRLHSLPVDDTNLWNVPQVITQKFPAEAFEVVTKVHVNNLRDGDVTGIAATGSDYATVQVRQMDRERLISYIVCKGANTDAESKTIKELELSSDSVYLKMEVTKGAVCAFSFSTNDEDYIPMGSGFQAKKLRWVGASIGLYCFSIPGRDSSGVTAQARSGYADFEWVRVTYQEKNI